MRTRVRVIGESYLNLAEVTITENTIEAGTPAPTAAIEATLVNLQAIGESGTYSGTFSNTNDDVTLACGNPYYPGTEPEQGFVYNLPPGKMIIFWLEEFNYPKRTEVFTHFRKARI
jgi:hypothetical protein